MKGIYYVYGAKSHHCYYKKYVDKYGKHFNEKLAKYASSLLKNADGSSHHWSIAEVEQAIKQNLLIKPEHATIGDITYLANMYYSDFYPEVLKSENDCIKAAIAITRDPDGYECMAFKRWKHDMKERGVEINFEEFI